MKRLIPLAVLALAACSETSPFAPSEPIAVRPAFNVSDESAGGVTLSQDTGCTHDTEANLLDCRYDVQNLPPGEAMVSVFTSWRVQYQCVSAKTGRSNDKRYPPTQVNTGLYQSVSEIPVNGQLSNADVDIAAPTASYVAAGYCALNKGGMTAARLVAVPALYHWAIDARNIAEPDDYFARREWSN